MPLGIEGRDEALHDGLGAAPAARGVLLIVALTAIGLVVLLVESLTAKTLATERAEEMLWMPGFVQSTHHPLREREGKNIFEGRFLIAKVLF